MDSPELRSLGWKACFQSQLTEADAGCLVVRVAAHFGSQLLCLSKNGDLVLPISLVDSCREIAVGDWLLLDGLSRRGQRRLERESLLIRKAAGSALQTQLIAANVDTLFIVSSCNQDFNLSRLERYLALALEARITPIVVLTKSDLCADSDALRQQVLQIKRDVVVELVDARDAKQVAVLEDWCGVGQTVGLLGSSGVGKSTLAMTLGAGSLATQGIREDDSKGRHTTTARCIHRMRSGGLLIDTPGMRELQLTGCDEGVADVFDDIITLSRKCRFRDCTHRSEPGCAIQGAIESGQLEPRRLRSYRKLQAEQARNAKSLSQRRDEFRKQGKLYKSIQNEKKSRRNQA